VLPEKTESKGTLGDGATSMRSPRPAKAIWASPATSAREAGAARALDAALAVEQDQLADLDGLDEVALLLDEAGLARAVSQGLVLQRALAALVADRAVERVVGQQELEHAVLGLLHLLGVVVTFMPSLTRR
jgi:hypothetical protein